MFSMPDGLPDREPTRAALAAIEREWPQIQDDLTALDLEIRALTAGDRVDELQVRRVRRTTRGLLRVSSAGAPVGGEAA